MMTPQKASQLRVGQLIETIDGPRRITAVEHVTDQRLLKQGMAVRVSFGYGSFSDIGDAEVVAYADLDDEVVVLAED